MSDGWQIAIIGASGLVGEAIVEGLEKSELPIAKLHLFSREANPEESLRFRGKSLYFQSVDSDVDWSTIQFAFFAATQEVSALYANRVAQSGCVVFDFTGYFSQNWEIPLLVPCFNDHVLADYREHNIIAFPHSCVSQALLTLKPIIENMGVNRLTITNLVPASGFGRRGIAELAGQSARLLNGLPIDDGGIFNQQLAFNVHPLGDDEQMMSLNRQCVEQIRRIVAEPSLLMSVSSTVVPVFYSNTQLINIESDQPYSVEQIQWEFQQLSYMTLHEHQPMPVNQYEQSGQVHVGPIQMDLGIDGAIKYWSVADNVRCLAAHQAISALTTLIEEYY